MTNGQAIDNFSRAVDKCSKRYGDARTELLRRMNPGRVFVICIDGGPGVAFPLPDTSLQMPSTILDLYSEQYAIERDRLSWAIVSTIPMPEDL